METILRNGVLGKIVYDYIRLVIILNDRPIV